MNQEPTSKFVKVRCVKCKNEQVVFGKSSSKISCHMCHELIAEPTGGKARFVARPHEVLE